MKVAAVGFEGVPGRIYHESEDQRRHQDEETVHQRDHDHVARIVVQVLGGPPRLDEEPEKGGADHGQKSAYGHDNVKKFAQFFLLSRPAIVLLMVPTWGGRLRLAAKGSVIAICPLQDLLQSCLACLGFLRGRIFTYTPPRGVVVAEGFDEKPPRPAFDDTVRDIEHLSGAAFSYELAARGGDYGSHKPAAQQRGGGQQ